MKVAVAAEKVVAAPPAAAAAVALLDQNEPSSHCLQTGQTFPGRVIDPENPSKTDCAAMTAAPVTGTDSAEHNWASSVVSQATRLSGGQGSV